MWPRQNAKTGSQAAAAEPGEAPPSSERRRFLSITGVVLGGVGAAILGVPVVGFLLSPLFQSEPREWRRVGTTETFKVGETTEVAFTDASPLPWAGITGQSGAWLRRESEQEFIAFAINCTHLGCPVKWLSEADLFMCPCHGGVYYKDGSVAAGPPPRPLMRYPVRVRDGQVEIQTSPLPIVG